MQQEREVWAAFVIAALVALGACGGNTSGAAGSSSAGAGNGGAGGNSGTAGAGGARGEEVIASVDVSNQAPCFDPAAVKEVCDVSPPPSEAVTVFTASEIAPDARFTMINTPYRTTFAVARADRDTGTAWWVVSDVSRDAQILPVEWPDADGEIRVVDPQLLSENLGIDTSVLALGCDDSGCTLLGAAEAATSMTPLEEPQLPPGDGPWRLNVSIPVGSGRGRVCVVGQGFHCYVDGSWVTQIPPEAADELTAAAMDRYSGIAAAADGKLLVNFGDYWPLVSTGTVDPPPLDPFAPINFWRQLDTGFTETYSIALAHGQLVAVLAENGVWTTASLMEQPGVGVATCVQTPPLLTALAPTILGQSWRIVVDGAGMAYSQTEAQQQPWCRRTLQPVDGILGASIEVCTNEFPFYNFFAITATEVLSLAGELQC